MNFFRLVFGMGLSLVLAVFPSCSQSKKSNAESTANNTAEIMADDMAESVVKIMADNEVDTAIGSISEESVLQYIVVRRMELRNQPATLASFVYDMLSCLAEDRHLWELVDKQHSLPQGYVPADLVPLRDGGVPSYQVSRSGLQLRRDAAEALGEMASAARAEGVTLVASSSYRSYEYQDQVYNRIVGELGQEAADRESARPGHSQHQTGMVVDFGSIDDSFALTAAGRWLAANALRFGWSLSYPDGYEALTGYRWESWHYRYVGNNVADFIDNYFDGIQQNALQFLHDYCYEN